LLFVIDLFVCLSFLLIHSTTDEWIKKIWRIYTLEYYSAIKKNEIRSFAAK
jgi:hypothetical protein